MKWITANGTAAPQAVVDAAEAACKEFDVPVGMVLAIIERECSFREPAKPNYAGATGYMQIKAKFAADYHRYAGFEFPLTGFEGLRGCVAALRTYAKWAQTRHSYKGDDIWRYVICVHRYGQAAPETKSPSTAPRVINVEKYMHRNRTWYNDAPTAQAKPAPAPAPVAKPAKVNAAAVAAKAAKWALDKVGCRYSQPQRAQEGIFDCSSLVARAYKAQGAPFTVTGKSIPRSCEEVYDDSFRLIWPASYAIVGKQLGRLDVIPRAAQAGDLQLLCTDKATSRANRITHITMVIDADTIVHARGTKYGVRTDPIDTYNGKVCALLRYDPTCPLRLGHKGDRVKALQAKLNAKGAGLVVDGDYGRKTATAVEKYGVKE